MKKTFKFILAAFAIVTAASCAQEIEDPDALPQEEVELVPMTITVGGEATKTTVGENNAINWCADDEIAVFDNTGAARKFTIVEGTLDGKTARFEGLVAAGSTDFTAVYPFSAAVSVADGAVTVNTPDVQVLDGATIADGATVSVAQFTKDNAEFTFKTAIGYLRVDVKEADVTSIIVKGTNIAGQASFNAAGELQSVAEGKNQVTLTPAGEVFTSGISYYVTVLPGKYAAEDFSITLVRETELAAELAATKEVTILRNQGFFLDSGKLSYKFVIKDAETLQKFLDNAADYTAKDKAEIVNDIDLTDVTLTPASSFKGVLYGGDYSLKNWTNDGLWLIKNCYGTIQNLKIDASCNVTPAIDVDYGIFASILQPAGQILSCENNADMTLDVATHAGSRFGAFVGKNDGYIKDCVNNGAISIRTEARTGNVYIGGFAGNSNPRNGAPEGEAASFDNSLGFENCTNNGDITYYCNSTGQYVFVGGISNSTTAALKSGDDNVDPSKIWPYCALKDCLNTGDIAVTVTNGGSMEENAGTGGSGNYSNVGGCVGFLLGELRNCDNKGNITFNVPTNETAQCMTRPAVGGVAGFVWKSLTDCDNLEGKVYVKGTFASGGLTNAGAGCEGGASFGGVVGQVGPMAEDAACKVSNCHNHADMEIYSWMSTGNGSYSFTGGVVGYAKAVLENCSNNGDMAVEGKVGGFYAGGVVGSATRGGKSLINNGNLTFKPRRTVEGGGQLNGDIRLGGVAGDFSTSLTESTNNSAMTVISEDVDKKAKQMRVGGVVGRGDGGFSGNVNNGKVSVNQASGTTGITLGGVVGWLRGTIALTSGTNNGAVEYNGNVCSSTSYIGGFAGYIDSTDGFSGLTNKGPVSVSHDGNGAGACRLGGVVGHVANSEGKEIGNLTNESTGILTTSKLPNFYQVGGIIGRVDKKMNFVKCVNKAAINVVATEATRKDRICVGGVVAENNDCASTYDSCENSGAINVNTATTSTSYNTVSGIVGGFGGDSNFILKNNINKGNIIIDCNGTGQWRIGGIFGYAGGGGACANNTVEADITLLGTSKGIHNVGGIAGYCAKNTYSGCTYKGTVTTNGGTDNSYVGGIVGRSNNEPMYFPGCTVKAVLQTGAKTYAGVVDGDLNAENRTANLGAEGNVTKILSGSSVNGVAVTSALEDNLLVGTRLAKTVEKTYCEFVTE